VTWKPRELAAEIRREKMGKRITDAKTASAVKQYRVTYVAPRWRVTPTSDGWGIDDVRKTGIGDRMFADAIVALRVPANRVQSGIDLFREWRARVVVLLVMDVPGEVGMPAICNIRHELVMVGMRGSVVPSADVPMSLSTAIANDHDVIAWLDAVFPCDADDRDEVYLQ
jgi:hypothetical protein